MSKRQKHRQYDTDFKINAARLANHPDIHTKDVAEVLKIHPFMLSRWKKELREGRIMTRSTDNSAAARLEEAKRRIRELEKRVGAGQSGERPVKKSEAVPFGTKREAYEFIERNRKALSVKEWCHLCEVSRSGYYAWKDRPVSQRARANERLKEMIEQIFIDSHGTYGSPRVHAELQAQGVRCSRRLVARLMREQGLVGRSKRVYRPNQSTTGFVWKATLPTARSTTSDDNQSTLCERYDLLQGER